MNTSGAAAQDRKPDMPRDEHMVHGATTDGIGKHAPKPMDGHGFQTRDPRMERISGVRRAK